MQVVGGSNPLAPTKENKDLALNGLGPFSLPPFLPHFLPHRLHHHFFIASKASGRGNAGVLDHGPVDLIARRW